MIGKKYRKVAVSAVFVACLALPSFAFAANEETRDIDQLASSNTSVVSVDYTFDASSLPDSGRVSVKQEIKGDGFQYKLYPTFDNKEEAIAGIKKTAKSRLDLLSCSYFLAPMSQENWKSYYDCMMKFYDDIRCPDWYKESDAEESALQCFFSLMENDGLNQQIIEALNEPVIATANSDSDGEESGSIEDALPSLPDQEMLEESLDEDETEEVDEGAVQTCASAKAANPSRLNGFNKTKGISYAKKYADVPNTGKRVCRRIL